jgi:hypothetical protein
MNEHTIKNVAAFLFWLSLYIFAWATLVEVRESKEILQRIEAAQGRR